MSEHVDTYVAEEMLKVALQSYFKSTSEPFRISISGPSSSGKTALLQKLVEYCVALGYTTHVRGSLSRKYVRNVTDAEQCSEPFQRFLVEKCLEDNVQARKTGAQIQFLDRTLLDGYVYVQKYGGMSEVFLKQYRQLLADELNTCEISCLLQRVVFQEDNVRRVFDRQFSDEFNQEFVNHWPKSEKSLVHMPNIHGIQPLYTSLLVNVAKQLIDAYLL